MALPTIASRAAALNGHHTTICGKAAEPPGLLCLNCLKVRASHWLLSDRRLPIKWPHKKALFITAQPRAAGPLTCPSLRYISTAPRIPVSECYRWALSLCVLICQTAQPREVFAQTSQALLWLAHSMDSILTCVILLLFSFFRP